MTYARLLAARGEFAHAVEVAASFDRGLSLVDLVFLRIQIIQQPLRVKRAGGSGDGDENFHWRK